MLMFDAVAWWLAVEVVGLVSLPLTFLLFRRLPDAGYAFTKPFGLLLGGYAFWLALSLHLLPNRPGSVVLVFLAMAAVSCLVARRLQDEMLAALRQRWIVILALEAVFTIAFFVAAYLRSFLPEIGGTEQPMDFMLLNTASP